MSGVSVSSEATSPSIMLWQPYVRGKLAAVSITGPITLFCRTVLVQYKQKERHVLVVEKRNTLLC